MTVSEDEDECLAQFLETEVLSEVSDQEVEEVVEGEKFGEREAKRFRVEDKNEKDDNGAVLSSPALPATESQTPSLFNTQVTKSGSEGSSDIGVPRSIETGNFSKVPPELFNHILKFLSSEDLVSCSLVCTFLNHVSSDEALWRRLYCMRWGILPPTNLRICAWKKLYIQKPCTLQRDEEDMVEFVRTCPPEFKEYYIQMQAAKRSQAPLPSQVKDDRIILDKTVADQVSIWKRSKGLTDKVASGHTCSGETCTYYQIGDVFVCEKTGHVHVCDDTCREVVPDPANELLVCTISGHCFDRLLSPAEMEPDVEQQQAGILDEVEPFMGSGRFARAYLLGYNCDDEKELEAALRFC